MYKLIKGFQDSIGLIKSNEDGSFMAIPFAPDNQDFVQYQKWLSEGNHPLPADEVTV